MFNKIKISKLKEKAFLEEFNKNLNKRNLFIKKVIFSDNYLELTFTEHSIFKVEGCKKLLLNKEIVENNYINTLNFFKKLFLFYSFLEEIELQETIVLNKNNIVETITLSKEFYFYLNSNKFSCSLSLINDFLIKGENPKNIIKTLISFNLFVNDFKGDGSFSCFRIDSCNEEIILSIRYLLNKNIYKHDFIFSSINLLSETALDKIKEYINIKLIDENCFIEGILKYETIYKNGTSEKIWFVGDTPLDNILNKNKNKVIQIKNQG